MVNQLDVGGGPGVCIVAPPGFDYEALVYERLTYVNPYVTDVYVDYASIAYAEILSQDVLADFIELMWQTTGLGIGPWDILEAFFGALLGEDNRFGDHDGDGIFNVDDPDYAGTVWDAGGAGAEANLGGG